MEYLKEGLKDLNVYNAGMLLLGYCQTKIDNDTLSGYTMKPTGPFWGLRSYVITPQGARNFIMKIILSGLKWQIDTHIHKQKDHIPVILTSKNVALPNKIFKSIAQNHNYI